MESWTTKNNIKVYRLICIRCNCYIICNGTDYILIDTSVTWERKSIEKQLDEIGIETLKAIIITHVHTDHVGNASYFQQKYSCPIYVHPLEYDYLVNGYCKMPRGTNSYTKAITKIVDSLPLFKKFTPCHKVTKLIDKITVPGFSDYIQLLTTPGHSAGSISILVDNEIALVGDAMVHSWKNTIYPPFADDETKLKPSWEKLLNTRCSIFLPAHGKENMRQLVMDKINSSQ